MPERPRADRLLRDELLLYQRRALRTWQESDYFAENDPAGWRALEGMDPSIVRVCLVGNDEYKPEPGCITVGSAPDHPSDFYWSLDDGVLPFEDQTVDCIYVSGPVLGKAKYLPKHLARVLRVGGDLVVAGSMPSAVSAALTAYGFDEEDLDPQGRRRFTLVQGKTSLEQAAPLLVDERNMGERVIREPRQPWRR